MTLKTLCLSLQGILKIICISIPILFLTTESRPLRPQPGQKGCLSVPSVLEEKMQITFKISGLDPTTVFSTYFAPTAVWDCFLSHLCKSSFRTTDLVQTEILGRGRKLEWRTVTGSMPLDPCTVTGSMPTSLNFGWMGPNYTSLFFFKSRDCRISGTWG